MNTLNNIYALVDLNTEQAKKTIIELSKLMRYVLYEANKNQISLEHEIQFLENYIALMKLRYIDNLNIRTEFPVVVPCVQIPPLLFISLLENAFKHGVSYQEPSFIEVRIELADEGVIFNCKNSKHTHAHKDALSWNRYRQYQEKASSVVWKQLYIHHQ
uniref:sensor histidine kinase n=1 Tax=Phocaeicola coprophilus TaxID=387090 RepID=UPI0027955329|nr:histidine kinase [Phocaeicola coprophilus]